MKQNYIKPSSDVLAVDSRNQLLDTSMPVNDEVHYGPQLSKKKQVVFVDDEEEDY